MTGKIVMGSTLPTSAETPSAQPRPDLGEGSIVAGRYEIIRKIGSGGMGDVYQARHLVLGRHVALKVLKARFLGSANAVARLKQEARVASSIGHRNIVEVLDVGQSGEGYTFVAMELLDGESLGQILERESRLGVERAVDITLQVCAALNAAHAKGVVHRDIKPENIIVLQRDDKDFAKIVDFGISKLLDDELLKSSLPETTHAGTVLGTPLYMAPEQARAAQDIDHRADIYSVGVVLFEMLTGTTPFIGRTSFDLVAAILSDEPRRPREIRPDIPADIESVVMNAIERERSTRYSSIDELAQDLNRVTTGEAVLRREVNPSTVKRRRVRTGALIAAGTGIGLVVVAAAVLMPARSASDAVRPASPLEALSDVSSHRQITFAADADVPALSPDGRWLAYTAGIDRDRVVIQDLVTGRTTLVAPNNPPVSDMRWSPDGTELLIAGGAPKGLRIVSRDGAVRQDLSGCGNEVAWSPDATAIFGLCKDGTITHRERATEAFREIPHTIDAASYRGVDVSSRGLMLVMTEAPSGFALWVLRLDGSDAQEVFQDSTGTELAMPRWSTDGDFIYYQRLKAGRPELAVLRWDGLHAEAVEPSLPVSSQNVYSLAAGPRLAWSRSSSSRSLWVIPGDGGTPRHLTTGSLQIEGATASPDRKRLAFSLSGEGTKSEIVTIPIGGGAISRVIEFPTRIEAMAWSPRGDELAFIALEQSTRRLWRVSSSGENLRRVGRQVGDAPGLAWAPAASIVYPGPRSGELLVLDPASGSEHSLLPDDSEGWASTPRVSPSGLDVAILRLRGAGAELWTVSLATRKASRVLAAPVAPLGWSEDGRFIYGADVGGTSSELGNVFAIPRDTRIDTVTLRELPLVREIPLEVLGDGTVIARVDEWQSDIWVAGYGAADLSDRPAILPPRTAVVDREVAGAQGPTNLDFEEGAAAGPPRGWRVVLGSAKVTEGGGAQGRSLLLEGDEIQSAQIIQQFSAAAYRNQRLRLRARMRSEGDAHLRIEIERRGHSEPWSWGWDESSTAWRDMESIADIPDDAEAITIRLVADRRAWFDDIVLDVSPLGGE